MVPLTKQLLQHAFVVSLLASALPFVPVQAFVGHRSTSFRRTTRLHAIGGNNQKCSPLPRGISPFEKSLARTMDIQKQFRQIARSAMARALDDGVTLLECDFPPLIGSGSGGSESNTSSKSQFDDFDNLQELNANRDWCIQLATELRTPCTWLILPDDKEVELAKQEWTGQRYRKAARFTSILEATRAVAGEKSYSKAWGASFAEALNQVVMGGGDSDDNGSRSGGLLGDTSALDDLSDSAEQDRLQLVCQPGNGGPVEDWINVERLHEASSSGKVATCIVNGALDKVRDGYYPALVFPALAKTVPFYKQFEAMFVLKPLSDKGLYGWLYRVYPEPWKVILQTAVAKSSTQGGGGKTIQVQETVALVSGERPSYSEAIQALVTTAASKNR